MSGAERWDFIKQELVGKCDAGSAEEQALLRCFKRHQEVIQLPGEPFKTTDTVRHHIDYEGPPTLFVPQYNIAQVDLEDTEVELQRLQQEHHIRESQSGFNAPIIPVRKKSGNIRLVNDYRQLNRFTRKHRFPLPRIDHILNNLRGARYFCVLDLKSGYLQIRLTDQSAPLAAFRTPNGCWEYCNMPFGLCNAPSTMQRLMLQVIVGLPNCSVFLDDILIHGRTLEECERNLDAVLARLETHNLTLQTSKCTFFRKSCTFLGHIISTEGISPDPEKVSAIKEFPVPKDLLAIRSFLGLTSYYRKFIRNYSQIAYPLHELTKGFTRKGKNIAIQWGEREQEAFDALKDAMMYNVTLSYPNFNNTNLLNL